METKKFFETSWNTEYEKFQNDPQYAHSKTIRELNDLVRRVIGEGWCGSFVFEIADIHSASGNDAFLLREQDGKIHISGPSGVALASGLNYYLKCFAKVNFNPIFGGNVKMPRELPHLPGDIRRETNYAVRYALNFCTYGYTMAFWGWKEYEAFLDWLAMNGVNLMLDIAGQEEVQRRLLRAYGYTEKEIRAYIPGPAYLPWFFMQNMSGFGGPLPDSWFAQRVDLGRRIHDRMQALGITPVLQGYAGMVPTDFGSKHPDAAVLDQGLWCGFPRPSMLKTQASKGKDYFGEAADLFYAKQREVFGSITHYYAVDPFHEGGNMGDMTPALVYHRVQEKMLENDPEAIWLLMQWQGQLNDEKLCNLAAPGQALILDVQADRRPYSDLMERQHIPWLWSMVHNFGGRMGVDGDAVTLAHEIPETFRRSRHMTGIAAAPEALINGPLVYDLLFDMTWENGPVDVDAYVQKYAQSRYGGSNEHIAKAWDILLHTAYWKKTIYTQGAGECVINARPSEVFRSASTWGHKTLEYDQVQFEQALPELLAAFDEFGDCEAFRYDVVDVAKQVLSNRANLLHEQMMDNYHAGDLEGFRTVSKTFLELIKIEDRLLRCCPAFCVEPWLDSARNCLPGASEAEQDLLEFNARALITTWGDYSNSEDCLLDYSNRQWAGLTKTYYLPRWQDFVARYEESLVTGKKPEEKRYFDMEWAWANEKSHGQADNPSAPDLKALAQEIYDRYSQTATGAAASGPAVNLALGKAVICTIPAADGCPLSNLTDGKLDTVWRAAAPIWPVTLTLDLESEKMIREIAFSLPQVAGDFPMTYSIHIFSGNEWAELPTEDRSTLLGTVATHCHAAASQIRLTFDKKPEAQEFAAELAEIAVYEGL